MFKKLLTFVFKLGELKNLKLKPGEGTTYKISLLLKPLKEKPRLFGFIISQFILWTFVILNLVYFLIHSSSLTDRAIQNGQMALISLESETVVVGTVITDKEAKAELERKYQEAQAKNLEAEKEKAAQEEKISLRAPALELEDQKKAKIVLIVTDLGLSKSLTLEALKLPKSFTMGFSPYANNIDDWVDQAQSKGFESIVNLPMQPIDYPVNDPGPYALLQNLSVGENLSRLDWVLSRSKKIVGVYTLANETFSSSRANLLPVLENLKKKRKILAYGNIQNDQSLTSLTNSINSEYTAMHVQIDEDLNEQKINSNLLRLEGIANARGYAVGYMNPYPITINQVLKWMDSLESKTSIIVPLSNVFAPLTEEQLAADKLIEEKERAKLVEESKKLEAKYPIKDIEASSTNHGTTYEMDDHKGLDVMRDKTEDDLVNGRSAISDSKGEEGKGEESSSKEEHSAAHE